MTQVQRVDLRVGFGEGLHLGSDEARRAHEAACIDARERQTVRYAVAPRRTLQTPRGTLEPGDAVQQSDFEGTFFTTRDGNGRELRHAVPAWRALREAVEDGRVLENDNVPEP